MARACALLPTPFPNACCRSEAGLCSTFGSTSVPAPASRKSSSTCMLTRSSSNSISSGAAHLWMFASSVKTNCLARTVAANRAWVGSDSAFWILYPDVLPSTDLNRMSEFHSRHGAVATLGLYQVPDPSRCGVAIMDHKGVIIDFEENPQIPRSNWVFSLLMVADRRLFDVIPPGIPADLAFHVLPRLLDEMRGYPIEDYLLDIGTMSNYQRAQITWPGLDVDGCRQPSERPDPGAPQPASPGFPPHRMLPEEI